LRSHAPPAIGGGGAYGYNRKTKAMAQNLSNAQKKEWAMHLYTADELTQKQIAQKVGVNENTVGRWVTEGNWDKRRKTLLVTKKEQLSMLYDILEKLTQEGKKALEDDDPTTNPNADAIIKITAAIKKIESETGIGEMIDTLKDFISFVQQEDFEAAQTINRFADTFIKDRLNSLKK
jgi:transposase-like protein